MKLGLVIGCAEGNFDEARAAIALQKPDLTERSMWGISAFDQMFCRIQYRQASYQGIYTPPEADRPNIQYTGYNGGSDWGSVAVDPVRGVIVANYNDMPNYNRLVPREEANRKGWKPREELDELKGGAEGAGDPQAPQRESAGFCRHDEHPDRDGR